MTFLQPHANNSWVHCYCNSYLSVILQNSWLCTEKLQSRFCSFLVVCCIFFNPLLFSLSFCRFCLVPAGKYTYFWCACGDKDGTVGRVGCCSSAMTALSGAALCSAWDLWKWQPPCFSTASNSLREVFTCLPCGKALILSLFYLVIFSVFFLPLWSSPSVMYSFFLPCFFCSPCTFPQSLEQCVSCLQYGELPPAQHAGWEASRGFPGSTFHFHWRSADSWDFPCVLLSKACFLPCVLSHWSFFFAFLFSAAPSVAAKSVICDCGHPSSNFSPWSPTSLPLNCEQALQQTIKSVDRAPDWGYSSIRAGGAALRGLNISSMPVGTLRVVQHCPVVAERGGRRDHLTPLTRWASSG